ncbi:MAG: UDP-N-acetylglucosamine 2-epimerase (non-hydrolyzing) [Dethiosulfovibrio peptidovorans]|nr:MAG: UDP-N-acetylglucosamine 2-epimerase (non-hydrolyzing) [Dethiosulfovibrio peptidovorans]
MTSPVVVLALGTRPEAIKMAPVYGALRQERLIPKVLVSGQHGDQITSVLRLFNVPADKKLDVLVQGQSLTELAARILPSTAAALREMEANYVLVHGDTLTTFAVAWAAFLERIPVGHVEAGLRSGSMTEPFPEEANRILTDVVSDLYFAPTEGARANLLAEGKPDERIAITGQTGIDAVLYAANQGDLPVPMPASGKLVTITLHRRENWPILSDLAQALARTAQEHRDHQFVWPVHLNPQVAQAVTPALEGKPNITVLPPLEYGPMAALLAASRLIVTDSGGLQEEGAALGIPVAVVRNVTERPEGLAAGILTLVGTDPDTVGTRISSLLSDDDRLRRMAASPNPYGDGHAADRVAHVLGEHMRS